MPMSFLFGKDYESSGSDAYLQTLRQGLRRQPISQNEDCLDVEYADNEAGLLFDVASAPKGIGVPCRKAECPFAIVLGEDGVRIVGSCVLQSTEDF